MKTKVKLILLIIGALALALLPTAFGQTNDPTSTNSLPSFDAQPIKSASAFLNGLILVLIPVLTPMMVRAIKTYLIPKLPSWSLPIVAPALVYIANALSGWLGGPHVDPLIATLLGFAGTGMREFSDQAKKKVAKIANGAKDITPLIIVLLLPISAFAFCIPVSGCNQPTVQKRSLNTLYTVHKSVDVVLDSYLDLVIQKTISTNRVPAVLKEYGNFQIVYNEALVLVLGNTNALAPPSVSTAAVNFTETVNKAKEGK